MISQAEDELGRCAELVSDTVIPRRRGNFSTLLGYSNEDLLSSVEALEDAIKAWRETQVPDEHRAEIQLLREEG
jgi:hypothetical protein